MFCFDTMVDVAKPGDRVTVTGEAAAPGHRSAVGHRSPVHKVLCQGCWPCDCCDCGAECRSKLNCSCHCLQLHAGARGVCLMREVYKQLQPCCSYPRVSLAMRAVCAADTSEHQEGNQLLPDRLHSRGRRCWYTVSSLQTRAVPAAGVYKAQSMRVNPRLRTLKSIYKTYIDIIHVSRDEQSKLFSVKTDSQSQSQSCLESSQPPDSTQSQEPLFQAGGAQCSQQGLPQCKGAPEAC